VIDRLRYGVRRPDGATVALVVAATLVYVLVVAAVALWSASSQRADARQGSIDEATSQLAVLAALAPRTVAAHRPLSGAGRRDMDASWRRLTSTRGTELELRIWHRDGTLLYESPGGQEHHPPPFAPGSIPAGDWTAQHEADESLDVYLPVRSGGRAAGVAELSLPLAALRADEAAQGGALARRYGIAGAVLWLLMAPIWLRVARLVARTWDPRRALLLRRVRRGLAAGELEVHYQPKVALASGALDGVEALVRWRRDGELVPPEAFLPAVERSPLIRDLTVVVLETALSDLRRWEQAGLRVGVAVNIAADSLADARLVDDVTAALRRHAVSPARLTLEITETAMFEHEAAGAVLRRLAGLGVALSVDDFGTGHSSMARVGSYPFSELKVDRSFVGELTSNPRPVVAALIRMSKTLGLRVVAEGVEDDATLAALRALGCDVAQGYLLGRPMPASDLLASARALAPLSPAGATGCVPSPTAYV
jgi:EAL domain-containing protein (putative c-di-GMP-specific phosphodiesterase class I)